MKAVYAARLALAGFAVFVGLQLFSITGSGSSHPKSGAHVTLAAATVAAVEPTNATTGSTITFATLSTARDASEFHGSVATFCAFFDFTGLKEWLVIVPDNDAKLFEGSALPRCRLKKVAIPFVVIKESELIPRFAPDSPLKQPRGYLKQMLLKLAIATRVTTGYYLVLDSDVYAYTPFSVADLFDASTGRARIDLEHPVYPNGIRWFSSSAEALQLTPFLQASREYCSSSSSSSSKSYPLITTAESTRQRSHPFSETLIQTLNTSSPFQLYTTTTPQSSHHLNNHHQNLYTACLETRPLEIGFTPMILHTTPILTHLIPRLESLTPASSSSPPNWVSTLLTSHETQVSSLPRTLLLLLGFKDKSVSWTEYGLYFYAAVAAGVFDRYHAVATASGREAGVLAWDRCLMNREEYRKADWGYMFREREEGEEEGKRPFLIVHGWMRIPEEEINARIGERVEEVRVWWKEELEERRKGGRRRG